MAVNSDGSVVVGNATDGNGPAGVFAWTQARGMQVLSSNPNATAFSVSGDGTVVFGNFGTSDFQFGTWTWDGTQWIAHAFGTAYSDSLNGRISGGFGFGVMSSDHNTFVGLPTITYPFYTVLATSYFDGINAYPVFVNFPAGLRVLPTGISADGNVVVGYILGTPRPVRLSRHSGVIDVTYLPFINPVTGAEGGSAETCNADGSLIVGGGPPPGGAVLWSDTVGLINLNQYLPLLGVDLQGSTLGVATGISGDGRVIIGRTNGFSSVQLGWMVTLPCPPIFGCHCTSDFNADGDYGTDQDIQDFFACLGGNCCPVCGSSDFNGDGDFGTDADIQSFFSVLGGGCCVF